MMKKLLATLIASAFATVAFAQDKMMKDEKKKVEATKPYGNTPTENKAPAAATTKTAPAAAPMKDAAPMKKDAPMATDMKDGKAMAKAEKKKMRAEKNKMRADKQKEEIKQDIKKP